MYLKGNQRGGAKDLAQHLLKEENDHVEVHELRGFISDSLEGALYEAYAVSRGTKAKQFLYSLSLNPPSDANVPTADFLIAIERIEKKLNLVGQPRAIVFHEKEGRRHAHAVWSRINSYEMKAIQMSHDATKLMDVSRELYLEHGWKMPEGLADRSRRDPRNFTLEEWQHAKRTDQDTRDIKTALQDAWAISDSRVAFNHALEERGYKLARGDRRGFVAIDYRGEVYSIPKWTGVKTKDVRERLGDEKDLTSVDDAKSSIGSDMLNKVQELQREVDQKKEQDRAAFKHKRTELVHHQRAERDALKLALHQRQEAENKARQDRFRKGLKGLWDRLRGEHKRIKQQNMQEAEQAAQRDRAEKETLIFQQIDMRRELATDRLQRKAEFKEVRQSIQQDEQIYQSMQTEWKLNAHPSSSTSEPKKRISPTRDFKAATRKERRDAFLQQRQHQATVKREIVPARGR